MRAIFDFIKELVKTIDGYWIESAGHPVSFYGCILPKNGDLYVEDREIQYYYPAIETYAFYDYPSSPTLQTFGIDSPDEIQVQFNYDNLLQKLCKSPVIGSLLRIEGEQWIVINRCWIYSRFVGKFRLQLTCQQYQESVTSKSGIHLKASCGNTIKEPDDE